MFPWVVGAHPWMSISGSVGAPECQPCRAAPLGACIRIRQSNPGSVELLGRFSYLYQFSMIVPTFFVIF